MVTVTTLDHTDGLAAVNKAIGEIEESITDAGGSFKIVMEVIENIVYVSVIVWSYRQMSDL